MEKHVNTIIDYIKWRKDLSFKASPFNEVDALIFARLAYLPFDGLVPYDKSEVTISEACKYIDERKDLVPFTIEGDYELVKILQDNVRFGDLKLAYYRNHLDTDRVKQFAAITILLDDKNAVVAYRGTDNSIVGWKEDFLMTFSDVIPSQTEAKEYLTDVAAKLHSKFRIVGHSKGGNLATFAASFVTKMVKHRIIQVYCFDGPGFNQKTINSKRYLEMIDKMTTYIPQTSVFGVMLDHKEDTKIIHADAFGIMQHDLYTWEVDVTKLKYLEENTAYSAILDSSFENYLISLTSVQRRQFVDILFEIVEASGVSTFKEIQDNLLKTLPSIIEKLSKLDKESSKALMGGVKTLVGSIADNANDEFKKTLLNYGSEAKENLQKFITKYKNN